MVMAVAVMVAALGMVVAMDMQVPARLQRRRPTRVPALVELASVEDTTEGRLDKVLEEVVTVEVEALVVATVEATAAVMEDMVEEPRSRKPSRLRKRSTSINTICITMVGRMCTNGEKIVF